MSGSSPQTLQDFLISLNYQVNEASQRKTETALKNSTFLALEAGKAFMRLAEDVWDAAHRMGEAFDSLYFAAQRTNTTIQSMQALSYAARQMGISAQGMQGAIESISKFMMTNPAGENFLRSLGAETRNANGQLLETGRIATNLGAALRAMPLPQANVIGGMLGIDYKTLLAMREGLGGYADEYRDLQARIHLNSEQAGKDANTLMTQTRGLGAVFDVIGDKINATFSRTAADAIHRFKLFLVDHFDQINAVIQWGYDHFVAFSRALESWGTTTINAVEKAYNWFMSLDDGTRKLILTFGEAILAWRLLNTAFAQSPIGRVILLGTAIIALLDDYNAWRHGGEHLIPWEKWETEIRQVNNLFDRFRDDLHDLWLALGHLKDALFGLGGGEPGSFSHAFGHLGSDALTAFSDTLHRIVNDATHLVLLMAKVSAGDWAGAYSVLQEWKYGTPEERAKREAEQKSADDTGSKGLDEYNRSHGPDWWGQLTAPVPGATPALRLHNRIRRLFGKEPVADAPTPTFGEMGPLMDMIGRTEGTGNNYNDTFGHGRYSGGSRDLSQMTLDQIDDMQGQMLEGGGQSPVGRFQFNRETLRDLRQRLKLTGSELLTPDLQKRLFEERIRQQGGPTPNNLRAIWPSLPGGSQDTHQATGQELDSTINQIGKGSPPAPPKLPPGVSLRGPGFDIFEEYLKRKEAGQTPETAAPSTHSSISNSHSYAQNVEINVHGSGDPKQTAAEVERAQKRLHRDLMRNGRTALV